MECLAGLLAKGCAPVEEFNEKVTGHPRKYHVVLRVLAGGVGFGLLCGTKLGAECEVVSSGILGAVLAPETVCGWYERESAGVQIGRFHGSRLLEGRCQGQG